MSGSIQGGPSPSEMGNKAAMILFQSKAWLASAIVFGEVAKLPYPAPDIDCRARPTEPSI